MQLNVQIYTRVIEPGIQKKHFAITCSEGPLVSSQANYTGLWFTEAAA